VNWQNWLLRNGIPSIPMQRMKIFIEYYSTFAYSKIKPPAGHLPQGEAREDRPKGTHPWGRCKERKEKDNLCASS